MTVEHVEKEEDGEGRFFVRMEGDEADLVYTRIGPHLIDVQHTYLPQSARGVRKDDRAPAALDVRLT